MAGIESLTPFFFLNFAAIIKQHVDVSVPVRFIGFKLYIFSYETEVFLYVVSLYRSLFNKNSDAGQKYKHTCHRHNNMNDGDQYHQ